jgi:hypothetical protein
MMSTSYEVLVMQFSSKVLLYIHQIESRIVPLLVLYATREALDRDDKYIFTVSTIAKLVLKIIKTTSK